MAELKIDVRKHDDKEGVYKINFINVEGGEDKIIVSLDSGIEGLYVIRDVVANAIKTIEEPLINRSN